MSNTVAKDTGPKANVLPSLPPPLMFFDKFAASYESSSAPMKHLANHLLVLGPALTQQSVVLDNACGHGIVTGEILNLPAARRPAVIHAADFSPKMIEILRDKASSGDGVDGVDSQKWTSVRSVVMDAQNLDGYANDMFTHSYTNFGIFIFPDPEKAAKEIHRTLKPNGGITIVTSWKTLGYASVFQRAAQAVRADAPAYHGPMSAEWLTDAKLRAVMEAGGFKPGDIEISSTSASLVMSDFAHSSFMKMMSSNIVKVISDGWTSDDRSKLEKQVEKEMESSAERKETVEMEAWVALARK
jgi:ubiquinone/menaquinone biosynthesis C-methylase UbiE